MTVKPITLRFVLLLLLASASCQTDGNFTEETLLQTSTTDFSSLANETFPSTDSSNANVTGKQTEFLEPVSETEENSTSEESGTQGINESTTTEHVAMCNDEFCENGGTCIVSSEGTATCSCPANFVGNRCQTSDNCTVNEEGRLCKNGVCVYNQSRKLRYCKCFLGNYWDSHRSECRPAEEPCFPNPCQSHGNCSVAAADKYRCFCPKHFFGRNCEIEDTCSSDNSGIVCEYGYCTLDPVKNRKLCNCIDGFYLDPESMQCKKIAPPCQPNPCMNIGICNIISASKFNCTCPYTHDGERCEVLNLCRPDSTGQICKNGVCNQDGMYSRRCFCSKGYYLDEKTNECKEVSAPCQPNPCANGGICNVISSTEFNCSCPEEYYGKHCTFVNKCLVEGTEFCKDADCVMKDDNDSYFCHCPPQTYFDYRSRNCKVLDMCPLFIMKRNTVCKNNTITCLKNFKEDEETGLCKPNFCETKACPAKGMICEENSRDPENYSCSCEKGYSFDGRSCNPAFCELPGLNNCEQICEMEGESFSCKCHDSFKLKTDNRSCEHSGNVTCANTTCENGQCIVDEVQEKCFCPPGYDEINGNCKDKCSAATLAPGVCPDNQCEATRSGFRCKCEGKYRLSPDNVTCTVKQLCAQNEYGWKLCAQRNAVCVNDWNETLGFKCKCPPGMVITENGSCREICSLEENKQQCSILGASCSLDNDFKFTCRCPPSFHQSRPGSPCNKLAKFSYLITLPIPHEYYGQKESSSMRIRRSIGDRNVDKHKLWKDITNSMSELYEAFETANILRCTDSGDFLLCTVEMQFTETDSESLKRIKDPSFCVEYSKRKDNLCFIPPALILRKDKILTQVSFERTDPCSEGIKAELCESSTLCTTSLEKQGFSCTCKPGFMAHQMSYPVLDDPNSIIETCNDVDECTENNPCPQGTTCFNAIGSYNCLCRPGYRTINVSSDPKKEGCIKLCDHSPCIHGTCAVTGDHSFECTCKPGFTGAQCNREDENYKDAKVNTIIVGAVLGGILLIVIIIFISKISRGHKKFGHESGQLILGCTEMTERRQMRGGIFNDAFERE